MCPYLSFLELQFSDVTFKRKVIKEADFLTYQLTMTKTTRELTTDQ